MSDTPTCPNCDHPLDFLTPTSGETWGGFCEAPGLPPGLSGGDRPIRGTWYWEYWVWKPETHAVRFDERIRVVSDE